MEEVTKVEKATREGRLADFGRKSETYDDVLTKLMDFYGKKSERMERT